jgi:LysR family pca operon transcriptional activator
LRLSDAIWIISRGVVADDLRSGELVELPIDVDIVTGPVGLTMRAHAAATPPIQIIRDALRAVAKEIGLTTPDNSPAKSQEPSDSELSDRGTDSVESGYD